MSKSFSQSLDDFVEIEVITKHQDNVEMVEDYVYNQIRAKSPVRDGVFKANHNRSSDAPDYSFDPDKTFSSEPAPTGGKFPVFFVANAAPYADELEHGHSMQAPNGVYGVTYTSAKARFGL